MNGRTLSRAIQSSRPRIDRGHDQDRDARRERDEPALPGPAARIDERRRREGGRPASQVRRPAQRPVGRLARARSIVPQTTRRGRPLRDSARASAECRPTRSRSRAPALAARARARPPTRPAWRAASRSTRGRPRSRRPACRSSGRRGRARPRSRSGRRSRSAIAAERELADILLTERRARLARPRGASAAPARWLAPGRPLRRLARRAGRSPDRSPRPTTGSRLDAARTRRRWRQPRRGAARPPGELPRERAKGGSTVRYDLRPLLADVRRRRAGTAGRAPGPDTLRPRPRDGRPEEVVAALGDAVGAPLVVALDRARARRSSPRSSIRTRDPIARSGPLD